MNYNSLIHKLERVESIASASKLSRMLRQPYKYLFAIGFREFAYKRHKRSKTVSTKTFFGERMNILLPASTDIYLTGGKSHDSEIRLAKFLVRNLEEGDVFIDVGAHYGYFSRLSAHLMGNSGKVFAFEASPQNFEILERNTSKRDTITVYNQAISDTQSEIAFYEFPNLYSEYSTMDIEQFENEAWFDEFKPQAISIEAITLDEFVSAQKILPKVVKIDVEGAEYKVVKGFQTSLQANTSRSLIVIMEYLSHTRGNAPHMQSEKSLREWGFEPRIIDRSGDLQEVDDVPTYLEQGKMESDNIAFVKRS